MKKLNKSKGVVFWITGLPGSGKTLLANLIQDEINSIYGKSIVVSGDDLRNIFNLKGYTAEDRKKYLLSYNKFCKFITNQKINIIFAVVGLYDFIRKKNKQNLKNYIEIFIDADINEIIKFNKKKIYIKNKNLYGVDIKMELPKKPDIIIKNDLKINKKRLQKILITKILNYAK